MTLSAVSAGEGDIVLAGGEDIMTAGEGAMVTAEWYCLLLVEENSKWDYILTYPR